MKLTQCARDYYAEYQAAITESPVDENQIKMQEMITQLVADFMNQPFRFKKWRSEVTEAQEVIAVLHPRSAQYKRARQNQILISRCLALSGCGSAGRSA